MAITRKPKAASPNVSEVDVEALINKGGSTAQQVPQRGSKTAPIVLRLPAEMLEQIDAAVRSRPVKTPRHTWILEAVYEKLARATQQ